MQRHADVGAAVILAPDFLVVVAIGLRRIGEQSSVLVGGGVAVGAVLGVRHGVRLVEVAESRGLTAMELLQQAFVDGGCREGQERSASDKSSVWLGLLGNGGRGVLAASGVEA